MNIHVKPGTSDLNKIYEKFKKDEVCETFYDTGELKERWTQKRGKLHGYYTSFFKSGNCQTTEAFYKDGFLHGPYRKFLPNGSLEAIKHYKDGLQEGMQEIFYEDGKVEERVNFEKGLANGVWEHFDTQGVLIDSRSYEKGEVV